MITRWYRSIHGGGLGINLLGLGLLGGILAAQIWFDHPRPAGLQGKEAVEESGHAVALGGEHNRAAGKYSEDPWTSHIRRMEEALAQNNLSAAEMAWHDAYGAALRNRRWQGLIAVGDASLRIGTVVRVSHVPEAKARRLYLAALFHARDQASLDGVLRAAEAFAALGDREVAAQAIRVAEDLAAQGREVEDSVRVRAFADRLAARFFEARTPAFDPF